MLYLFNRYLLKIINLKIKKLFVYYKYGLVRFDFIILLILEIFQIKTLKDVRDKF